MCLWFDFEARVESQPKTHLETFPLTLGMSSSLKTQHWSSIFWGRFSVQWKSCCNLLCTHSPFLLWATAAVLSDSSSCSLVSVCVWWGGACCCLVCRWNVNECLASYKDSVPAVCILKDTHLSSCLSCYLCQHRLVFKLYTVETLRRGLCDHILLFRKRQIRCWFVKVFGYHESQLLSSDEALVFTFSSDICTSQSFPSPLFSSLSSVLFIFSSATFSAFNICCVKDSVQWFLPTPNTVMCFTLCLVCVCVWVWVRLCKQACVSQKSKSCFARLWSLK